MRHRQHRQNTRDGLVLGLLPGGGHAEGVADGTDARPKNSPAVMSSSDVVYAHQIGTASASDSGWGYLPLAGETLPMPIIAPDTAKDTAAAAP
jgi:hypothetical protein